MPFTSEGGAKGKSDGQPVCYTLHGVERQPRQEVQLLPGVGRRGNPLLGAAQQHDVAAHVQGALDPTGGDRGGHWRTETTTVLLLTLVGS